MKNWILGTSLSRKTGMTTTRVALFSALVSLLPFAVNASGQVSSVDLQDSVVVFSTTASKQQTSPNCMAVGNADKWAISLNNATGRAAYTMLMSAMASGIDVQVETAGDCADAEGFERPLKIVAVRGNQPAASPQADAALKMAPDLNVLSRRRQGNPDYNMNMLQRVDTTAGFTTVVNLTGKNVLQKLYLSALGEGELKVRLTVDGELIWDDTVNMTNGSNYTIHLINDTSHDEQFLFEESFVFEVFHAADNNINVGYGYRPVK